MEKIAILHTNDLHSHFENIPNLKEQLLIRRDNLLKSGYEVITVDIGDCCDRFHPLTEATMGKVNVDLLNDLGVQYFTIGNNEGLGLKKQQLLHLYDNVFGKCVLGNMFTDGKLVPFAKKYDIYETLEGTRIAFIGLTASYPESYLPLGWDVTDPILELAKIYEECKGKANYYVLLSHLGYETDVRIAKENSWLDVIIGGHTHHLLENGEMVNETLLTAAGKHGQYFGEINLFDKEAKTYAVVTDYQIAKEFEEEGRHKLAKTVYAKVSKNLSATEFTSSLVEAFLDEFKTDLVVLNDGLCIKDLHKGLVTKATLHELFPHPMHLMKVKLPGKELKRLLFEMRKNQPFLRRFKLTGFGFRGKVFGNLITASKVDLNQLETNRIYTLLTVDHYAFIPYFPTIAYVNDYEIMMDSLLREQIAKIIPMLSDIWSEKND